MYAIVDIETTGGHASSGAITEVAIILHNGKEIEGKYQTLVNPEVSIPRYITALTGISNEMVRDAPVFSQVAPNIFSLLSNRVFIAHNVNFDYSFLKHNLLMSGYQWEAPKLCTVRMSKKIFPGYASYSLGNICRALQIHIADRHRAAGDAEATAKLFNLLLENDTQGVLNTMLKKGSRESYLPLHLPVSDVEHLPHAAGVYYFHDQKHKIIYVGKAKDLKQRVTSHFSNNSLSRKKQELMRSVHRISFALTGTEFTASILESLEIRKHWPQFNTSQKVLEFGFGLFMYEDQQGRKRLCIDRLRKNSRPLRRFALLTDAHRALWRLVKDHQLCAVSCFLQKDGVCETECKGVCRGEEPVNDYNKRVDTAIMHLQQELPSFAILEPGREKDENAWLLMEDGRFYGLGFLPAKQKILNKEQLKNLLTPYNSNEFVRTYMLQYAEANPSRRMELQ
ncbi:MAG TPA: exonuclease domain-containing protein [Chitinophagaceae bacterium]|nr:exonuclease domain-containing protein [Chitinophagaceae bacterium]